VGTVMGWEDLNPSQYPPVILPVQPDARIGRMGQQSSCFTLHMHGAAPMDNPDMKVFRVPSDRKEPIRKELHRLGVNQFTAYADLDSLSKEIRRTWNI